jgi:hypothetical protein
MPNPLNKEAPRIKTPEGTEYTEFWYENLLFSVQLRETPWLNFSIII